MARVIGLGWGLLFLAWAVVGCRAERAAFRFQPESACVAGPAPDTLATEKPGEALCLANDLLQGAGAAASLPALPRKPKWQRLTRRFLLADARCEQLPNLEKSHRQAFPAANLPRRHWFDDPPWGGIMLLLGLSLCVGAVVVGLSIGGLSGLGIGVLLYLVGAYLGARGFAGPGESASASISGPTRHRRKFIIRNKARKAIQDDVSATSLGEIFFIIGGLAMITGVFAGIIVGLLSIFPSISLGALALWLFFGGGLVGIVAYNGIR